MNDKGFRYDVGLSFAGEQREYVSDVASELEARGIHVFYDDFEQGTLWGKDLYEYLSDVYQHMCDYCVIFASAEYAAKVWTNRERKSAQARAIEESREYILPARFDNTPIPGLLPTVHYIDLTIVSPGELCDLIEEKLDKKIRWYYLPPILDRLYQRLGINEEDWDVQDDVYSDASSFLDVLRRMESDERKAVINLIRFGCPGELPANLHINADLLRRITGMSVAKLQRIMGDIRSLGFLCTLERAHHPEPEDSGEILGEVDLFKLKWDNMSVTKNSDNGIETLMVVDEMIMSATVGLCDECGDTVLERLDFSQLASATATDETHDVAVSDASIQDED